MLWQSERPMQWYEAKTEQKLFMLWKDKLSSFMPTYYQRICRFSFFKWSLKALSEIFTSCLDIGKVESSGREIWQDSNVPEPTPNQIGGGGGVCVCACASHNCLKLLVWMIIIVSVLILIIDVRLIPDNKKVHTVHWDETNILQGHEKNDFECIC